MNKDTFDKAVDLHKRIEHYDKMIDELNKLEFNLDPPTRNSGVYVEISSDLELRLNEEDVICIKEAFEKRRDKLNTEFVML